MSFKQLDNLSNREAKAYMKNTVWGESTEGEIIYTKYAPSDVSKLRLYMYFVFMGWFGIHNLYVGKKRGIASAIMGSLFIVFFTISMILSTLNYPVLVGQGFINFALISSILAVFPMFCWAGDFLTLVILRNFAYPARLKQPVVLPYFYEQTQGTKKQKQKSA